jgi:hypothetical protein
MHYPDQWTNEQVEEFYAWVSGHPAFQAHVPQDFPGLAEELRARELRPEDAEELALYLKWLRVLPYADRRAVRDLLVFYFTGFQRINRLLRADPRGKRLCALFPVLIRMLLQGSSIFPRHAGILATALMRCLKQFPADTSTFDILASLMTDVEGRFLHGFNADELKRQPLNALIKSEHVRRAKGFEYIYKAKAKYDEYKGHVTRSAEFHRDWKIVKRAFPANLTSAKKTLCSAQDDRGGFDRSRMIHPRLAGRPGFPEVFDFFCWKWFLDGMEGDEPLVAKLSFDVTPFGTTIFIPGYWSFDPDRDIQWKELLAFHRSRGVKRQGETFDFNRREHERKKRLIVQAKRICDRRGESRQAFIERAIQTAGLAQNTDPAYIDRLLREGKADQRHRR